MPQTTDFIQRLTALEIRLAQTQQDLVGAETKIGDLETKVYHYDKLAAKTAGILMGMLALGAFVGGNLDKLKEKLWSLFQ